MKKDLQANNVYSGIFANRNLRVRLHEAAESWGSVQARHLLMRASFGASKEETDAAAKLTRDAVVQLLLNESRTPAAPGEWVDESYNTRGLTKEERKQLRRLNRKRMNEIRRWWISIMSSHAYDLREKMVLFWHGHFATESRAVKIPQLIYKQNKMLRRHALGNFGIFLKEMWKDPAMLIYLNGAKNVASNPNENFARELLELFTMGIGNYTETDIKESARAFTGWRVSKRELKSHFRRQHHDSGRKTFLNQTGNFGGDDIIDIVLQQPAAALFICEKLYRYFVGPEVDQVRVSALATVFRNNNYEIKPVLRHIFTRDYFYTEETVGALIKSPVQLVVSMLRQFEPSRVNLNYLIQSTRLLDQVLLDPPNVAGWPGQRSWISPQTLATRSAFGEFAILGGRIDRQHANTQKAMPLVIDALTFSRSFGVDSPHQLVDEWIKHVLPFAVDPETKEFLLATLVEGAEEADWSLDYPGVTDRIKNCLAQIVRLPEYQLT